MSTLPPKDGTEANLRIGAQARLGQECPRSLLKRREAYFDLLVLGYSIELIASHTKTSASAVRRAVGQALARRRLDAPEDYARLQVARLIKALRCADVSLEGGDLEAIAPYVKVVRELNLYHDVNSGRATSLAPPPEIAPTAVRLALTHSPGMVLRECSRTKKAARKRSEASEIVRPRKLVRGRGIWPCRPEPSNPSVLLGWDSAVLTAEPYWVRWPGAADKLNRLARSCPMFASFASSINRPGVAQAWRSVPILDWYGSTWLTYQLLAGTAR
jgi:hypothetical protein